jgi:hypothetical protein
LDLRRDDRVLVHSTVATREGAEGEVKMRGRAVDVDDLGVRARYCDAVVVLGWRPEEPWFHLFRIDIDDVTLIRYAPSGDQYVARWPPEPSSSGERLVRPASGHPSPQSTYLVLREVALTAGSVAQGAPIARCERTSPGSGRHRNDAARDREIWRVFGQRPDAPEPTPPGQAGEPYEKPGKGRLGKDGRPQLPLQVGNP